jgi:uncharacterized RDD family membrane protein YckC
LNSVPAQNPEYVGFFKRCVASVIDSILVLAIVVPLGWSKFHAAFDPAHPLSMPHDGLLGFVINWVLLPAAVVLFWRFRGGTPGKMVVGAEIVDADSFGPPSNLQLVIRYVGYFISTIVFCLGFFWIIWDGRKQGWHDKLAKTVVVKRH